MPEGVRSAAPPRRRARPRGDARAAETAMSSWGRLLPWPTQLSPVTKWPKLSYGCTYMLAKSVRTWLSQMQRNYTQVPKLNHLELT